MEARNLDLFKLSHQLTLKIYEITKTFPKDERFGLISQMRRSSASIPMNIMEGAGRNTSKEYIHFLSICSGSCEEIKYQILLSKDLKYIDIATYEELTEQYSRISKMIYKLIQSLSKKV